MYFYSNYVQARLGEQDEALVWLRTALKRVVPLQQLCRKVIRRHSGHNLWEKVERLPVPRALKDYVLMKDVLEHKNESVV
ncbi:hypothetical protein RRG08_010482 [Elysia crispata]|nr:hypothetical protein RRG08_010482 [Elysia crispata]